MSRAVTMHVKALPDRASQNTSHKEPWTQHFSFFINLSVNTLQAVQQQTTPPQSVPAFLRTAKCKRHILSVLPGSLRFVIATTFFPFWQYRSCSAVWQRLSGSVQWKKLLPNHSSQNLWSYSATELFCQVQAEQFLPSFPSCIYFTRSQSRLNPKWKRFQNYLVNVWSKSLISVSII